MVCVLMVWPRIHVHVRTDMMALTVTMVRDV